MYGNILLAGIGEKPTGFDIKKETILNSMIRYPGDKLCYELTDQNGIKTKFIPLYRVEEETYSVYLDLSTEKNGRKVFSFAKDGSSAYDA